MHRCSKVTWLKGPAKLATEQYERLVQKFNAPRPDMSLAYILCVRMRLASHRNGFLFYVPKRSCSNGVKRRQKLQVHWFLPSTSLSTPSYLPSMHGRDSCQVPGLHEAGNALWLAKAVRLEKKTHHP
jgi:hypothetical protein